MATIDQRNAVFDAVKSGMIALVRKRAPGFIESAAENALASDVTDILEISDSAIAAYEAKK